MQHTRSLVHEAPRRQRLAEQLELPVRKQRDDKAVLEVLEEVFERSLLGGCPKDIANLLLQLRIRLPRRQSRQPHFSPSAGHQGLIDDIVDISAACRHELAEVNEDQNGTTGSSESLLDDQVHEDLVRSASNTLTCFSPFACWYKVIRFPIRSRTPRTRVVSEAFRHSSSSTLK